MLGRGGKATNYQAEGGSHVEKVPEVLTLWGKKGSRLERKILTGGEKDCSRREGLTEKGFIYGRKESLKNGILLLYAFGAENKNDSLNTKAHGGPDQRSE